MKKLLLALALVIGCTAQAHADYFLTLPWTGYTLHTNDDVNSDQPYMQVVSNTLYMLPGTGIVSSTPGISSTYLSLGIANITSNGTVTWDNVSDTIDLYTANGHRKLITQNHLTSQLAPYATVSSLTALSSSLSSYTLTSTYSAGVSSLTTAVNGKYAQPVGTTGQYVRGDGSLNTFPSIPAALVFSPASASRTLNTAYQLTATNGTFVNYSVDIAIASLLTNVQGTLTLEYADNSGISTNVVTVLSGTNAVGGVININNTATVTVSGFIPAGKWVRLRTANTAGTPTFTYRTGQEVAF